MKINEELDSLTKYEYIMLLNSLICYYNSIFDEELSCFIYKELDNKL